MATLLVRYVFCDKCSCVGKLLLETSLSSLCILLYGLIFLLLLPGKSLCMLPVLQHLDLFFLFFRNDILVLLYLFVLFFHLNLLYK